MVMTIPPLGLAIIHLCNFLNGFIGTQGDNLSKTDNLGHNFTQVIEITIQVEARNQPGQTRNYKSQNSNCKVPIRFGFGILIKKFAFFS